MDWESEPLVDPLVAQGGKLAAEGGSPELLPADGNAPLAPPAGLEGVCWALRSTPWFPSGGVLKGEVAGPVTAGARPLEPLAELPQVELWEDPDGPVIDADPVAPADPGDAVPSEPGDGRVLFMWAQGSFSRVALAADAELPGGAVEGL